MPASDPPRPVASAPADAARAPSAGDTGRTAVRVPLWLADAVAAASRPMPPERLPLELDGRVVGSVEPVDARHLARAVPGVELADDALVVLPRCAGDAESVLAAMARALREAGRLGRWRDEALPVTADDGTDAGSIERAAVRRLGIRTFAVHLNGWTADGRLWVQQRAFDKATDPGMWDTLAGGLVAVAGGAATEGWRDALAREVDEEAGLALASLEPVVRGGTLRVRRPVDEGWMTEDLLVWDGRVPAGVEPRNRDGEVAGFACLPVPTLLERLEAGAFTLEARLVIAESLVRRGLLGDEAAERLARARA